MTDIRSTSEKTPSLFVKIWRSIKEFFRKQIVSLKRSPARIVIALLIISYLIYTLNLSSISNTTYLISGANMGLYGFCSHLFSILAIVAMLNVYPRRSKPKIFMLIVTFVLIALVMTCQTMYYMGIVEALHRDKNPIVITPERLYIIKAMNIVIAHLIALVISAISLAILPLIKKALNKINTAVQLDVADINNNLTIDDNV